MGGSTLPVSHRFSFLLPLVILLLSTFFISALASEASETAELKSVGPGDPVLNVSLSSLIWKPSMHGAKELISCERIQVSGYSRTKLRKYAHSFRVNLTPMVNIPERLHNKIQVCFHRNASLGMCQCEKADWKKLQRGLWTSVMSPYDKKYIDVKFSDESSGSVTIYVAEDFQQWRILCLVVGLLILLVAPVVSSWLPFYYSSSMAVGIFLVILFILFQVMKLLPTGRKNFLYIAFYGSVVGAGSFILHQFSVMVNMILENFGLSEDMYNPVAVFVLVGIVIAGAAFGFWTVKKFVISADGGVDASVAQFVKWAMRTVATTFIFQSTLDTPLAMGALLSASLFSFLISKMMHNRMILYLRGASLEEQSHWEGSGGKKLSMHGRAEFLSRSSRPLSPLSARSGLWNSARRLPPSADSLLTGLNGMISPTSFNQRRQISQDYYSTYHTTPNRRKISKRELEELSRETTREAMAGLAATPEFSDWIIEHAERIQLLPSERCDEEVESESDSTGEQPWSGLLTLLSW